MKRKAKSTRRVLLCNISVYMYIENKSKQAFLICRRFDINLHLNF